MNDRDLELLNAYLDGALDAADRAAIESRLETDSDLAREWKGLEALDASLQALPRPTTIDGNDDALVERLRGSRKIDPERISWPILIGLTLLALASLVILAALCDEIANRLSSPSPSTSPPIAIGKKAGPGIATLSVARGDVVRYAPASKGGDRIEVGARIDRGDTLGIESGASAIVTLDGGGTLTMFERSQVGLVDGGAAKLYEGDLVAALPSGSRLSLAGEGITLELESGTCEFGYEDLRNVKTSAPPRLRIALLRGSAAIGDRKLAPGDVVFVREGKLEPLNSK